MQLHVKNRMMLRIKYNYYKSLVPGACFSKVLVTFRARKAALCSRCLHYIQNQMFNNFENDTMKL